MARVSYDEIEEMDRHLESIVCDKPAVARVVHEFVRSLGDHGGRSRATEPEKLEARGADNAQGEPGTENSGQESAKNPGNESVLRSDDATPRPGGTPSRVSGKGTR